MATYHHSVKTGKKGTAASHAAYIARRGKHRTREDLVLSGHGNLPEWAENNPTTFWRAGDKHERANGAVYREHEIALPQELTKDEQHELVKELIDVMVGEKPYQFAIHAPRSAIESKINTHLHLMYSDRVPDGIERSPEQTFSRYNPKYPECGGRRKDSGGKSPQELRENMIRIREASAELQNAALERHGHSSRVDHRSLKVQGIARSPERHLGPARVQQLSDDDKSKIMALRAEC